MSKMRTICLKDESGFVFTATATVVCVILGLTILFMANTIRSESVRASELYSAQSAYWQAVADVQMAATMIQNNGTGSLTHIGTYFPNITITQIDQTNMTISSIVTIGSTNAGAERAASIDITSPVYSIIQNVSGDFDLNGFCNLDGGNLYIGGNVEIGSFLWWSLADVGHDSTVHFFLPTGNTFNPSTPSGGDDYIVTNVAPISIPGFDASIYQNLLNYAAGITSDNPSAGEWNGNTTFDGVSHPTGLDLQNASFTGGGLLTSLGYGIFINGDLHFDGSVTGTSILDNNTVVSPGFIVVNGDIRFDGDWFFTLPTMQVPDNIIIIASGDVELDYAGIGSSAPSNHTDWSNYVNEIYTQSDIEIVHWTTGVNMFGQFHVMGTFDQTGWFSDIDGVIYVPNSTCDFGSFYNLAPDINGTIYIKKEDNDKISWLADVNLDSRTTFSRAIPGGIVQPASIPWIISNGSLKEI